MFSDPFFGHSHSPFARSPFFAQPFEEDVFSPFRAPPSRYGAPSRRNPFEAQRPGYGYPAGYPFGQPHTRYTNARTPSASSSDEDYSDDDSYADPRHHYQQQQQTRGPVTRAGPGHTRTVPVTSPQSPRSAQDHSPARGTQPQAPQATNATAAHAAAAAAPQALRRAAPAMSPVQAATRIQSVWRGQAVRAGAPLPKLQRLRELQGQTDQLERQVAAAQAHNWGPAGVPEKERLRLSEGAMALLLKLDAVQSPMEEVRFRRKALARRLNALHDRVDALPRPSDTPASPVPASPAPVNTPAASPPTSPRPLSTVNVPSPPPSPSPSQSLAEEEDDDGASFHSAPLSPNPTLHTAQEVEADMDESMDVDEVSSPATDIPVPSADVTFPAADVTIPAADVTTPALVSAPASPAAQRQDVSSPAASEVSREEALPSSASAPPSLASGPTLGGISPLVHQTGAEATVVPGMASEAPRMSWRNPFRRFGRRGAAGASAAVHQSKVPRWL